MANPFQFSAELAARTSANGLQYEAAAADFGTPLVRGVQSGMGLAQQRQAMDLEAERMGIQRDLARAQMGESAQRRLEFQQELALRARMADTQRDQQDRALDLDAERLEIQQALAEAQAEENTLRRMDYASELALRQQVAQTRIMEVENQRAELELNRMAGEETRSYRSMMMMRELQESGPLDLGDGKFLWGKLGPGGVLSPVEVDEKHPAVVSSRSRREQQQKALDALTDQRMRGRGGSSGGSDSARIKALSDAAESLEKSAEAIPLKDGDGSRERKAAMLSRAGMFRSMIEQELGVAGDAEGGAAQVSPAQRALTAARRMAEAKVLRTIPGLGDDPEQFSQNLHGAGLALRMAGKGWLKSGRQATDDEMAASIVEALTNPETSQPDREFLIELIRSFGR